MIEIMIVFWKKRPPLRNNSIYVLQINDVFDIKLCDVGWMFLNQEEVYFTLLNYFLFGLFNQCAIYFHAYVHLPCIHMYASMVGGR